MWICNVEGGINLFSVPLLYYPYILRAYRLYVVFEVNRKSKREINNENIEFELNSL